MVISPAALSHSSFFSDPGPTFRVAYSRALLQENHHAYNVTMQGQHIQLERRKTPHIYNILVPGPLGQTEQSRTAYAEGSRDTMSDGDKGSRE